MSLSFQNTLIPFALLPAEEQCAAEDPKTLAELFDAAACVAEAHIQHNKDESDLVQVRADALGPSAHREALLSFSDVRARAAKLSAVESFIFRRAAERVRRFKADDLAKVKTDQARQAEDLIDQGFILATCEAALTQLRNQPHGGSQKTIADLEALTRKLRTRRENSDFSY